MTCSLELKLSTPNLVDDLENSTDLAYCALPDRIFLSDEESADFAGGH